MTWLGNAQNSKYLSLLARMKNSTSFANHSKMPPMWKREQKCLRQITFESIWFAIAYRYDITRLTGENWIDNERDSETVSIFRWRHSRSK